MIVVNILNEGERLEYFELLRILYPHYETSEDNLKLWQEGDEIHFIIDGFKITFPINRDLNLKEKKLKVKQMLIDNMPYNRDLGNWGVLKGMRPVKLALKLLLQYSKEECFNILHNQYRISSKNSKLLLDIADIESGHIYPMDRKRYSLYLHIPFCPSICSYCSFHTVLNNNEELIQKYIAVLIEEVKYYFKILQSPPHTIYIGGGTPTSLKTAELERLLKSLKDYLGAAEFTIECGRPDTVTDEKLRLLKNYGVNRISLNAQSTNALTLNRINRNHSIEDLYNAFELADKFNFSAINTDIILGLPGENLQDVKKTLSDLIKLCPENITVHSLSLKKGSKLFKDNEKLNYSVYSEMLSYSKEFLFSREYFPYYLYRQKRVVGNGENIGYTKRGFESIYNIMMMEEGETIIAMGLGSSSKFIYPQSNKVHKYLNYRDFKNYFNTWSKYTEEKKNHILTLGV